MDITLLDSRTAMRDALLAPLGGRRDVFRPRLERATGMYRYFPGEVDVVEMHHLGGGFRLDADDARYLPALERMAEADAWGRVGAALRHGLEVQIAATPSITVPDDITMLLILAIHGDEI